MPVIGIYPEHEPGPNYLMSFSWGFQLHNLNELIWGVCVNHQYYAPN
jgi:hypothetical protein